MNIFSELYGTYFSIAKKAQEKINTTEKEIHGLINSFGFEDSPLFLPQKLIPNNDGTDWGLLRKKSDGKLYRIVKNTPPSLLTKTQKMWIKAKLEDPRIQLFLDAETIDRLKERLSQVQPLYDRQHFRYTDKFSDGDSFEEEKYRRHFRIISNAIKCKQVLCISFTSGHNKRISGNYLPVRIQYSEKNDKFRLLCFRIYQGKISGSGIINIGRIISIQKTAIVPENSCTALDFFQARKCREPVVVKVRTERNGVERFMAEFAPYEKRAERDLETGNCTVSLWFDKQDETEILIRLLSFGPVLEIIGPPDFRKQAEERVKKQLELLNPTEV